MKRTLKPLWLVNFLVLFTLLSACGGGHKGELATHRQNVESRWQGAYTHAIQPQSQEKAPAAQKKKSPALAVSAIEAVNAGAKAFDQGDFDLAVKLFSQAIESGELIPQHMSIAYYNRGTAWGEKKEYDQAINDYNRAIDLNPEYADAYGNRAFVWKAKGDLEKAKKDAEIAKSLNPSIDVPTF